MASPPRTALKRADEHVGESQQLPEQETYPAKHGLATIFAFVIAGAARARVGTGTWWANGLEMLTLGVIVGVTAFYAGAFVAWLLEGDTWSPTA